MQWNNYKYYNTTSNTSVAPDLFKTTYAANVKIDDGTGTGTTKEHIYLEGIDYRLLIIVSNGKIHTYLLDPTTGEQLLKFDDYDMTDTNIGSSTAFSLWNTLGYAMDIDSISIYTKPTEDFTMAMSTPEYIESDDSIAFDMDKAVDITSANGLTVTDSQGNEINAVTVSADNTKLTINFDKVIQEKYIIKIKKGVFGDKKHTSKNDYIFTVYTFDNPILKEDFSETILSSKLSIPANSSITDGVLKMGQYTQNMININAANGVTEFDLSVTDTATNPELWYLFRIVEKTSNNVVSPDAANSEVLKLKFTDAGLNITLTDKNTAVGSTDVPGITKNNTYTLRLVNTENKIELQMKSNGVWESVYSGELTSAPYSSYMSFNWRGTAFKAAIDNLKFYDIADTYDYMSKEYWFEEDFSDGVEKWSMVNAAVTGEQAVTLTDTTAGKITIISDIM